MKTNYLTKVEDRYVFRVSTAFWHLLIGIITLAAVAGIIVLAWSLIPPGKEKVKAAEYPAKPKYPPMEKVTLADLETHEAQPAPPPAPTNRPPEKRKEKRSETDPGRAAYDLVLSELKKIIPSEDWQSGYWFYPYGELAWQMHPADPNYRYWVASGDDMEKKLEYSYTKIQANDFASKKTALQAYLKVLKQVPPEKSGSVVLHIIRDINDNFTDLHFLDSTFTMVANNLKPGPSSAEMAEKFLSFLFNNPQTAFGFIPFAAKECAQLSDSLRAGYLTVLTDGFYRYFNNVEVQTEATGQFKELLPQLKGMKPSQALQRFYDAYYRKNQKRDSEIQRLDEEYSNQVGAIIADSLVKSGLAEVKFLEDKQKKSEMRSKSLYAVAGGFVAIALLGTILTLLSIQRILRRMEALDKEKVVG